jgi:hypothetical protein
MIIGYDLTGFETDKFDDWKWTEEGEKYFNNQVKDEIQLFNDPMSGKHLYFGYILAWGDEYDFKTEILDTIDITYPLKYVFAELKKLQEIGVISMEFNSKYKVILFEECR